MHSFLAPKSFAKPARASVRSKIIISDERVLSSDSDLQIEWPSKKPVSSIHSNSSSTHKNHTRRSFGLLPPSTIFLGLSMLGGVMPLVVVRQGNAIFNFMRPSSSRWRVPVVIVEWRQRQGTQERHTNTPRNLSWCVYLAFGGRTTMTVVLVGATSITLNLALQS